MYRRWRRPRRSVAALVALVLLLAGCASAPRPPITIRIATGSPAAVYHAFGESLARIINRELTGVDAGVLTTAASVENVALVSGGGAELGFTQADALPITAGGDPGVLAVARIYDDLLHLVTRADGRIRRLEDLRGARVSIGAPGSGTEITASRLLRVSKVIDADIHVERLGLDESVRALAAGEIDAFLFSGGPPVAAIAGLAAGTPLRLVDLGPWVAPLRTGYGEVYVARDVPRSVYRLDPITTVAVPNYLIVAPGLPDDVVEELTRLLMEHREELGLAHPAAGRMSQQSAITTPPLDLHPGAARYYRDHKP
ncbi:TAXI family TRAP transporter solute-binding subunit [Micromonospora sp. NPDC049559]|uniref:TAXI family TRAP transporter solute-binding subunit n=1 Tax=Micromonospora sp. NPDC049559 TaxID=3155923 RepID=UPI00342B56E1